MLKPRDYNPNRRCDTFGCKRYIRVGHDHCLECLLQAGDMAFASPVVDVSPTPTGASVIDQGTSAGGAKADHGKLGTHLLPTRPLQAIAQVLDFGAKKYAPNNWRKGLAYTRVYGAVLRHLWAWWQGEALDAETGQPHLACAACELLFLLEYELGPDEPRRVACDDRTEMG